MADGAFARFTRLEGATVRICPECNHGAEAIEHQVEEPWQAATSGPPTSRESPAAAAAAGGPLNTALLSRRCESSESGTRRRTFHGESIRSTARSVHP